MSTPEMPARLKGVDKIKEKNEHWFANNEVHEGGAKGPFPNGDRFAVIYNFDVTLEESSHGRQADADGRGGHVHRQAAENRLGRSSSYTMG